MAKKDYRHRDVIDKLGIKPGHIMAMENMPIDDILVQRALSRAERPPATEDELVDVVMVLVDDAIKAAEVLQRWRLRLKPNGGIWLLTCKRGQTGYVDQRELIAAGPTAGVVDNKVCSISDGMSATRFVIRKSDRPA